MLTRLLCNRADQPFMFRLVIKQMTGLESDRRCWHQIGAVLAEKSVGEVLPILTFNRDKVS